MRIEDFDILSFLKANEDMYIEIKRYEVLKNIEEKIEKGEYRFHPDFEPFNEKIYLKYNPQVAKDIENGFFSSGFEHFCKYGYQDIIVRERFWPERKKKIRIEKIDYDSFLEANPVLKKRYMYDYDTLRRYLDKKGFHQLEKGKIPFHPDFVPFDELRYREFYPKVVEDIESGYFESAFHHFAEYGYREILERTRYWPPVDDVTDEVALSEYKENPIERVFWTKWYLRRYGVGGDPLAHYLSEGWKAGNNPNPFFDSLWYFENHMNEGERKVTSPWEFYLEKGWRRGDSPSYLLDAGDYRSRYGVEGEILDYLFSEGWENQEYPRPVDYGDDTLARIIDSGLFDYRWYVRSYDLEAGIDPLREYCESGWKAGRDPNRWFDSSWYIDRYLRENPSNPLLDYIDRWKEGREPSPKFDSKRFRMFYGNEKEPLRAYLENADRLGRERFDPRCVAEKK